MAYLAMITVVSVNAQKSFGVQVSGISARQIVHGGGQTYLAYLSSTSITSWKAGLVAHLPLKGNFSLMPQVNLTNKGSDYTGFYQDATEKITAKGKERVMYLELPVYVLYKAPGVRKIGFFGGLGPVLGFGLNGTLRGVKTTTTLGATQTEDIDLKVKFDGKMDVHDNYSHQNLLDIGASIIAGYQWTNGVFVNTHYNQSFTPINMDKEGTIKNQYFGLSIGYYLSRH